MHGISANTSKDEKLEPLFSLEWYSNILQTLLLRMEGLSFGPPQIAAVLLKEGGTIQQAKHYCNYLRRKWHPWSIAKREQTTGSPKAG